MCTRTRSLNALTNTQLGNLDFIFPTMERKLRYLGKRVTLIGYNLGRSFAAIKDMAEKIKGGKAFQ